MVDFTFYEVEFHGSAIPVEQWDYYAARAEDQLEQYKRAYRVRAPREDSEARAVCAMAEAMHNIDIIASNGGPVNSASIGSVSVSYGSSASQAVDITPKGQARELYRCARLYLDICRGCGQW